MESTEQISLLINKKVKFSKTSSIDLEGTVLDKVEMKEKPEHNHTITGYIIQTADGQIFNNIAYWRIKQILN